MTRCYFGEQCQCDHLNSCGGISDDGEFCFGLLHNSPLYFSLYHMPSYHMHALVCSGAHVAMSMQPPTHIIHRKNKHTH